MNSSDESPAVVELPDDAIEALVEAAAQREFELFRAAQPEGMPSAIWDEVSERVRKSRRNQIRGTVEFVAARVRAEALTGGDQVKRLRGVVNAKISPRHLVSGTEAVAELVAAVRAGAVAERDAIIEVIQRYLPDALPFNTLPEIVGGIARQRDFQRELKDHLAEVARRLTDERAAVVAEAVAGERQRAAYEVQRWFKDDRRVDWGDVIELGRRILAGSVPVATPEPCDHGQTEGHWATGTNEFGYGSTSVWCVGAVPLATPPTDPTQPVCDHYWATGPHTYTTTAQWPNAVGHCPGPVAIRQPGRVGFGTDAFEVGGSLPGQPVATATTPGRVTCRRCGYFVDSDAHERTCGRVATPTEPADEWGAPCSCIGDDLGNHDPACEEGQRPIPNAEPPASPVPAEQPSAAEQALAARAEQALAQQVLDAHDDELGTQHGVAYRAMVADHWRLIETFEPHRTGARAAFDRRAGEGEAQAELLGHRLAVGETAEQPEER